MNIRLRIGVPDDATVCGRICYDAFGAISHAHGFPNDYPSVEAATGLVSSLLGHPGFYAVVAEADGSVVGSNFMDERAQIAGVGPVSVEPGMQDRGVGRLLMQDVLQRAAGRHVPGIRLLQTTYHNRSLSLYAKLGFRVHELVACMQGSPPKAAIPGYEVRAGTVADIATCDSLCVRVHGHDRHGEVVDSVTDGTAWSSSVTAVSAGTALASGSPATAWEKLTRISRRSSSPCPDSRVLASSCLPLTLIFSAGAFLAVCV